LVKIKGNVHDKKTKIMYYVAWIVTYLYLLSFNISVNLVRDKHIFFHIAVTKIYFGVHPTLIYINIYQNMESQNLKYGFVCIIIFNICFLDIGVMFYFPLLVM
jgi:hypothetical protein